MKPAPLATRVAAIAVLSAVLSAGAWAATKETACCGSPATPWPSTEQAIEPGSVNSKDWIVRSPDNICGLKEAGQLSRPAQVNYRSLLEATPELRKLKREGIESSSPEGIRLATAAATRVAEKCEEARLAGSYCSVWKEIKHKDGRVIDDLTERVKALL
jgi:hypothetical protein